MKILLATDNEVLAILIKRSFSRFHYEWHVVNNGFDAFQTVVSSKFDIIISEFKLPRMTAVEFIQRLGSVKDRRIPPSIVITLNKKQRSQVEEAHLPNIEIVAWPIAARSFVALVQRILHLDKRVVCFGGGTGLFTLLSGLKTLPGIYLSSIVGMSDDGGSTGRLRTMFGMLPPGDVRRSLVALSKAPDLFNELIGYRFERGKGLEGHNLGNLILTALTEMRGSMTDAVKSMGKILDIQGDVIPVTENVNTLKAELEDGTVVEGENRIDMFQQQTQEHRIKRLWQEPETKATMDALEAIYNADYLVLGPGDLFTSIISNIIVGGIADAFKASRAKKIYICNVMTKPGETHKFQVSDHIAEINKYIGRDQLDYVFCSSSSFPEEMLEAYQAQNQYPVVEEDPNKLTEVTQAEIIWGDFSSDVELLRHDGLKLATQFRKIVELNQKR